MHSSVCSFVVWIAVSPTVCLSWVDVANLSPLVLDTLRRVFGGFICSQGACLEGLEDNPNPKFLSKKHSERYGYLFSREKVKVHSKLSKLNQVYLFNRRILWHVATLLQNICIHVTESLVIQHSLHSQFFLASLIFKLSLAINTKVLNNCYFYYASSEKLIKESKISVCLKGVTEEFTVTASV